MAKYLLRANYTQAGRSVLVKEGGTKRRAALAATIESVGGSLEDFYFAFGETDIYMIADLADDAAAAALSLRIGAAGALDVSTTVLLTAEAVDDAVSKHVEYRLPSS